MDRETQITQFLDTLDVSNEIRAFFHTNLQKLTDDEWTVAMADFQQLGPVVTMPFKELVDELTTPAVTPDIQFASMHNRRPARGTAKSKRRTQKKFAPVLQNT